MKVRVLGCSGAIAKDCRTTSFLIDGRILIDAGTGVGDLSLDEMQAVDDVFLTHSHLDHIAALPLMLDAVASRRAEPLRLHPRNSLPRSRVSLDSIAVSHPSAAKLQAAYAAIGLEGVAITTAYNRFGQTIEVRQPLPDGTAAISTMTYDKNGQVVRQTNALGQTTIHTYDARQLLATTTDATGRKIEYRYDALGRVLQRIEDPGAGKLNLTTTTVYDGQGRQITVTDASVG